MNSTEKVTQVSLQELGAHDFVIPLGSNCSIAHFLRKQRLRKYAFPFDWTITPVQSALQLLEGSFNRFLASENLHRGEVSNRMYFDDAGSDVVITNEKIVPMIDQRYQLLFPHDFRTGEPEEILAVQAKYSRRIDRLLEALESPRPQSIAFIACNGTINDWQRSVYESAEIVFSNHGYQTWKQDLLELVTRKWPQHQYHCYDFSHDILKPKPSFIRSIGWKLRQYFRKNS